MWNMNNQEDNPYKIKWNDWKDTQENNLGKYYIKSGKQIVREELEKVIKNKEQM